MKTIEILTPLLLVLLLNACATGKLAKIDCGPVEAFRAETLGFGSAEGTAVVPLYNGNKKNVTFGSARLEVRRGKQVLGVVTLLQPVTVPPGYNRIEIPVRIRVPQDGLKTVMKMLLRKGPGQRPPLRIAGVLGIDCGGRRQTVRFNRRASEKMLGLSDRLFTHPIEFRLSR